MTADEWVALLVAGGLRPYPPATERQLAETEAELGLRFPDGLRAFYLAANGAYSVEGESETFWPLDRCVREAGEPWLAGEEGRIALVAFGDNGCGEPFCVRRSGGDEVVCWYPIDGEAAVLAPTVADFVRGWLAGTITS